MKKYKIIPPMGSIMVPKEWMTEKEIREYISSIIGDPEMAGIWREKSERDPIDVLIDYLKRSSFTVYER